MGGKMKVKIIKSKKSTFWYGKDNRNMVGEVRKVKLSYPRTSFKKHPIRFMTEFLKFRVEDFDLSYKGCGFMYNWEDIRIVSFF